METTNQTLARLLTAVVVGTASLGACGGDDSEPLASGVEVGLVGDQDLGGQTLNITVTRENDQVAGEVVFTDTGGEVVTRIECADTTTSGTVVLAGPIIASTDDDMSGLLALYIKDGNPDRVAVWLDEGDNDTCDDLLNNRRDVLDDDSLFVDVEPGSDIKINN